MATNPLLPAPECLTLDCLTVRDGTIVFIVRTTRPSVSCPVCGCLSDRVHSRYKRALLDLPLQGNAVRIEITTRRFFCDNRGCIRRIFTESIPKVAARYARKTGRLADALQELAFLVGGEAAARIAARFGLMVSADALLDALKKVTSPIFTTPRILGVDDFAFRRGHRYGTILVDLERHCPTHCKRVPDLLPDRDADTLAAWLRAHPGIEIISRDRAKCYLDAASQGAPAAIQVADRWHLLKNLGDTLERTLRRFHRNLAEAGAKLEELRKEGPSLSDSAATVAAEHKPSRRAEQDMAIRHEAQEERYNRLKELHGQGFSVSAIAREAGMSRMTVRKYLRSPTCPFYATRSPRPRLLAPYEGYLQQRWKEGCHNAARLYQEIIARGYRSKQTMVKAYLQQFRSFSSTDEESPPRASPLRRIPAPSSVRWWLLGHFSKAPDEADWQRAFVERLVSGCLPTKQVQEAALAFISLVRERRESDFSAWLEQVSSCSAWEIRAFAQGLVQDEAAVRAALSLEWSNGQVEGQVNRLKFLKRSMYGRGGFDLLKARVLHRADNPA
jgi:transposase